MEPQFEQILITDTHGQHRITKIMSRTTKALTSVLHDGTDVATQVNTTFNKFDDHGAITIEHRATQWR